MTYYASPRDLPAPWKQKRVIFYAQGLKIYGCLPYLLAQRLDAEFISNNASFLGGRIITPTMEDNYTLVRYRRRDGRPHRPGALEALLDWLFAEKGFEWAIAGPEDFGDRLDLINFLQRPPHTYAPAQPGEREQFLKWLAPGD